MLYAIGDCHGRFDLVQKLYSLITEDIKKVDDPFGAQIIFLGDYVDRGPHSKEVLDFLMQLTDTESLKHIVLMGNHELMMYDAWIGIYPNSFMMWVDNGGKKTLKSFDIVSLPYLVKENEILKPYMDWIKALPIYYTKDDYIFCHSGYLRTDFPISLDVQTESLLWGRPHKGQYTGFNKWVIHGHTPQNGKPEIDVNRINVDIGCGHPGYNSLCSVVLPHHECKDGDFRFIIATQGIAD